MNTPNSFAALATTAIIAGCATTPRYPEGHDPEELLEECRYTTETINKEIQRLIETIGEDALIIDPANAEAAAKQELSELDVLDCTTDDLSRTPGNTIPLYDPTAPIESQAKCVNGARFRGKNTGKISIYSEWGYKDPFVDGYPVSAKLTDCVDKLETRNLQLEAIRSAYEKFEKAAKGNPPFQNIKAKLRRIQRK